MNQAKLFRIAWMQLMGFSKEEIKLNCKGRLNLQEEKEQLEAVKDIAEINKRKTK